MTAISPSLFSDVTAALRAAGRTDLVERLAASANPAPLTSKQAATVLGVASANTVKNWLEGGWFPGAFQTPGGHWRFPVEDVEAVRLRLEGLRDRNSRRDLTPVECDDETAEPPLS
ncbi:helix-turn-helix domain-containing protein [Vulcanococcus limneticus]|uniref:helix-turn-helix domain-containing protein n=1 Tax=Vulcanococcus limneticus TaxID=2170428 RepID=UPI00398BEA0F